MDGIAPDLQTKYDKLASEYSKLRAQATVLRRAVLDEQSRSSNLKDTLRSKEIALRRTEQEVDSLCFRNEQLLRRVSALQDDLDSTLKNKKGKRFVSHGKQSIDKTIIDEDLQKKIIEIADLSTQVTEKDSEIALLSSRIEALETRLSKQLQESSNIESKLRKQLASQRCHSGDIEIVSGSSEAASLVGSEDSISITGNDDRPTIGNNDKLAITTLSKSCITSGDTNALRITELEKEVQHWRTEYELQKMLDTQYSNLLIQTNGETDYMPSIDKEKGFVLRTEMLGSLSIPIEISKEAVIREDKFRKYFAERLNLLAEAKALSESQVTNLNEEILALQNRLEMKENEIESMCSSSESIQIKCKELEDELATTRLNYEHQLRLVTEHAADLYDQLGPVK